MPLAALPPEASNDEEGMRQFGEFFRNLLRGGGDRPR